MLLRAAAGMAAGVAMMLLPQLASADVRSSTELRFHPVQGRSAQELVSYMADNPLPLRNGRGPMLGALATTTVKQDLDADLVADRGGCRVRSIDLHFRFVITLPRAVNERALSQSTRSAWRDFTTIAKRHEEAHRTIYVNAGKRFVARAAGQRAGSCAALRNRLADLLARENRTADREHGALDGRDTKRIPSLALFKAARRGR